eukprot:CAMPEP_0196802326 /NCGR_PEP_ID=MMETSP1362-20130617/1953_1 /TAXON_ID=163516 /ORGANISM="Leptocylindrus danicus, Strain CCMP1856" /LENGTH=145 /DNA_ID=CAMNT_0042173587 /DNA_START=32 /DNA_END=466 /DNA_ORIENTATION=+
MKIYIFLLSAIGSTQAWSVNKASNGAAVDRRNVLSGITAAAFGVATATAATSTVPAAFAADFIGSYSDPNHPNCPRLVATEGDKAIISGADGNPGCPTGDGRAWRLEGEIKGDNIFVDFSPKGGPKGLQGKWDGSGIRWPDGNKW